MIKRKFNATGRSIIENVDCEMCREIYGSSIRTNGRTSIYHRDNQLGEEE